MQNKTEHNAHLSTFKPTNKKCPCPPLCSTSSPIGCVIGPDQSWFNMIQGIGIDPRHRQVTQRKPLRAFLWHLTHSHWKKEAHTFWLITSHDDTIPGQMADMSTSFLLGGSLFTVEDKANPSEGKWRQEQQTQVLLRTYIV